MSTYHHHWAKEYKNILKCIIWGHTYLSLRKGTSIAPWRSRSHYPFQGGNSSPYLPVPAHKETEVPSDTHNGNCSLYINGALARSPSKSVPLWKPETLTLQSLKLWGQKDKVFSGSWGGLLPSLSYWICELILLGDIVSHKFFQIQSFRGWMPFLTEGCFFFFFFF